MSVVLEAWQSPNGKLYPLDILEASGVSKDEASGLGGAWHKITVKSPWNMEDDSGVEQDLITRDPISGQFRREGIRFNGVLIGKAVLEWTFGVSADEKGFRKIAVPVGRVIAAMVHDACYGEADDPALLDFLEKKRGPSSEAAASQNATQPSGNGGLGETESLGSTTPSD